MECLTIQHLGVSQRFVAPTSGIDDLPEIRNLDVQAGGVHPSRPNRHPRLGGPLVDLEVVDPGLGHEVVGQRRKPSGDNDPSLADQSRAMAHQRLLHRRADSSDPL